MKESIPMSGRTTVILALLLICAVAMAQTGSSSPYGSQGNSVSSADNPITNGPVAEYISDSAATVGWSMHGSGNTSIKYGNDREHMDQTAQATPSKDGSNYHARIEGLMPGTRYYFQVMQNGQPVGGVGTFRTVASGAAPVRSKATIPQ
jgi:hypothetical protein